MKVIYYKKNKISHTYIGLNKKVYPYVFCEITWLKTFHMELKYIQLIFNTCIGKLSSSAIVWMVFEKKYYKYCIFRNIFWII
jgi:hypothetical protein